MVVPGRKWWYLAGSRTQLDRDSARDVEPLLTAGQTATKNQVIDIGRIQLRDLVEGCPHHLGGQVVGAHADQRPLNRTPDR
jgi:hypothetical protein